MGGGFAVAVVGLALLAWLILKLGLRLPTGWFFGLGSALMAVLAVVLAGKGIAALQHAGKLPPSRGGERPSHAYCASLIAFTPPGLSSEERSPGSLPR